MPGDIAAASSLNLALGQLHADTEIANSQIDVQYAALIASFEIQESTSVAQARQTVEVSIANSQYAFSLTTGLLSYTATVSSANIQANAETTIGGYDAANVTATATARRISSMPKGSSITCRRHTRTAALTA